MAERSSDVTSRPQTTYAQKPKPGYDIGNDYDEYLGMNTGMKLSGCWLPDYPSPDKAHDHALLKYFTIQTVTTYVGITIPTRSPSTHSKILVVC
eukprot:6201603-Pleurochrysis_carterae.AAC.1